MLSRLKEEHGMSRTAANKDSRGAFKRLKYRPLWRCVGACSTAAQNIIFAALHFHAVIESLKAHNTLKQRKNSAQLESRLWSTEGSGRSALGPANRPDRVAKHDAA
jgi:hypothetical protein